MTGPSGNSLSPPPIRVHQLGSVELQTVEFNELFRVGRAASCEFQVKNDYISRVHAEVFPDGQNWLIRDANSSNGLFVKGKRVESIRLTSGMVVRLGIEGPELAFELPRPSDDAEECSADVRRSGIEAPGQETIVARYASRYFGKGDSNQPAGEQTMFIRRAFAEVQSQQQKKHSRQRGLYIAVIASLLLIAAGISTYAWRQHKENQRNKDLARDIFFAIKTLDVEIAGAERIALSHDQKSGSDTVRKYELSRKQMQTNYERDLATLHVYDPNQSEQHRLILRIARIFGECELDMPPDFEQEVNRYIRIWQTTGRFAKDVRLAQQKGYTKTIPDALLAQGLPVQFFYLAMVESDFNTYATGPITRKGFAKGMWQFIPETGAKYGLHIGPLVDLSRPDPADERDQADKATAAASAYLAMLYGTDAQASGLLVMACYNWGEGQVLPMVQSMPLNPRDRNFWRFLSQHRDKIPPETYNYVFSITAAAVIGENPRLFGFDFDNPLQSSGK
jgi:membrane-bound lytic murein transglycosylase D